MSSESKLQGCSCGVGRSKLVVGTGSKPMKASCIGAASMTSGFGPSYQECLWLCRKSNFSSAEYCVMH